MNDLRTRLESHLGARYRILRELGAGGMAVVYLATDTKHDRQVALKVLRPEVADALGAERFLREIDTVARLTHPHILPLHDSGEAGGLLYYVMPYVEGESLRERLKREGALPVDDALQIARECAAGLAYAHDRGVLHRDIKPANILLSGGNAVLADFGIARALEEAAEGDALTRTGVSIGTVGYMSPEQASGEKNLDARSDVYALGCVLYEMLAGEPAFRGPTAQAVIARQLQGPPSVTTVRSLVPTALEEVIEKTCRVTPGDRYGSAAELSRALQGIGAPAARGGSRRQLGIRGGIAATVGALVFAGWVFLSRGSVEEGPAPAPPGAEGLGRASIAVLPLRGAGTSEDEVAFLADGFHSEILTQLTKIGALEVIGRASVARYASTERSVPEIGQELGVATVLDGTVLSAGGQVRLNLQLVEVQKGRQLWAEAYARSFTVGELFQILEDIATQVAAALEVALTPEELEDVAERPTDDADAYEHYVRGETFRTGGVTDSAVAAYERAVELDPEFALAWARLAEVASWHFFTGGFDLLETARTALERARALAPDGVETLRAQGAYALHVEWDHGEAAAQFNRMLERRPNDAGAVHQLSRVRAWEGRWDEAERLSRRALALDPLHATAAGFLAIVLANTGRMREAARYFDRGTTLAPEDWIIQDYRARVYAWGLGDTATVRAYVGEGPSSLAGNRHRWRVQLAYLQRDADAVERLARDSLWSEAPGSRYEMLAMAARLRNDAEGQAVYGDSVVAAYENGLQRALDLPEVGLRDLYIPWYRSQLAEALALSGAEERALREAERAVDLWVVNAIDRDRFFRWIVLAYTFLGHEERAIELIQDELEIGSPLLTPVRLRMDPDFDGLRDHPRFQALLEEYGRNDGPP